MKCGKKDYIIVSIFIEDEQGRMLLQLRDPNVKIYPNRWDQVAGGRVDEGFNYDQTAENELAEELDLRDVMFKPLGTFRSNNKLNDGRIINQFERVYVAHVPGGVKLNLQLEEVTKLQRFTPAELKTQIAHHPEKFTPGLLYGLRNYFPDFKL